MRWIPLACLVLAACGKDADSGTTPAGDSIGAGTSTGTGTGTGTATGAATGTGTGTGSTTGCATPTVDIGGTDTYTHLAPGSDVEVVYGPQGGWHLWVSGEAHCLGNTVGIDVRTERVSDGVEIGNNSAAAFLALVDYDEVEETGWFPGQESRFQLTAEEMCAMEGVEVDLCARVEDLLEPGRIAESCTRAVTRLGPYDEARCAGTGTGSGTGTGTGAGTGTP